MKKAKKEVKYNVPKPKTAQGIFNAVVRHLLKQNARSTRPGDTASGTICAYRGDNGLMCAVGCLLPDDVYVLEMEGKGIYANIVFDRLPDRLSNHADLLGCLQRVHDNEAVFTWPVGLKEIAFRYDLKLPKELQS